MDHPSLMRAALAAFEDAEQARTLAVITLYTDVNLKRVLRGPRKGQHVGDALDAVMREVAGLWGVGVLRHSVVRPWWCWWRRVRRLQVFPPDVRP